jgi:hypothetical protein
MFEYLWDLALRLIAIGAAMLPKRYWEQMPHLPIRNVALASAIVTIVASAVIGLGGFLAYSERVGRETAALILRAAEAQLQGKLSMDPALNVAPLGVAALTPMAFIFTPVGFLTAYLALSGLARAVSCVVDEPFGDPVLTGVDAIIRRATASARDKRQRRARVRAEGEEVADRLYPAEWAGIFDADFVVVSSRRKPGWEAGTFVITSDKWYQLGMPLDLQLAEGLRTIYPLKEHTINDVLRRGVSYELPPLRKTRPSTKLGARRQGDVIG